jgi:hypothetical protein
LALPREAPDLLKNNSLAKGLGKTIRIDCQCVSAPLPKPINTSGVVDPSRTLRALMKFALRRCGLRYVAA